MVVHVSKIRRRTFTLAAVACTGGWLLPKGVRARGPRVLVLGGSAMVGSLGRFLEEELAHTGYTALREAKISSGLARPDFFDWPARARELYAEFQPAATVCMFGGNDGQGLHMGVDAEPPWIRWHESGWSAEYGRRVKALLDAVAPYNEHVFWLGMPMMATHERTSRMDRLNRIAREQIGQRPHGYFLDTWQLLADKRGYYSRSIKHEGRWVTVRAKDGVHFTRAGARLLVEYVGPIVRATLGP